MKLNNKGFALTSIIYMLIVLFLMIMLLVLANLAQRKVVLDKMKYDVKDKLGQGGLLSNNSYIVTFDAQGGEIKQQKKQVEYNKPYGELPIPTKEGYRFLGWRGKNLFDNSKITSGHYIDTNGEEQTEPSGYPWSHSDFIEIIPGETYTFTPNTTLGNTAKHCIYDENKSFIRAFDSGPTTMEMTNNAKYIRLSFRTESNNIQFEEGSTGTSYEPYQEYTSNTIVTKQEDHTLYAKWEKDYIQYNNLNFIKSNGNQFIDLGYKAKTNTEIRLDIELVENENTNLADQGVNIIGSAGQNNTNARFSVNFGSGATQEKNIFYWTDKAYSQGGEIKSEIYSSVTPRSILTLKSGTATFQGITTETATKTENNTENMILLGNYSSSQQKIEGFNRYDAKVYGFQIYEGESLIKNLIPVKQKSDNSIGLFDTITQTFYKSDGEQDFLQE